MNHKKCYQIYMVYMSRNLQTLFISSKTIFIHSLYVVGVQIPDEPDFLLVYSAQSEHIKDKPADDESLFIKSLVEVLQERLKNQHFEDALLWVKDKIACNSSNPTKQIPIVISQMRDKIWFNV